MGKLIMNLVNRIRNKIKHLKKTHLINKYDGQLSFDINKSIVISSVPRGGSTWFSELLSSDKKAGLIWEPLSLSFYPDFNKLHFKERQYLSPQLKDNNIYIAFKKVLSGNHLTHGILQRTEVDQLVTSEYLIVKFCRANRLLPWLTNNFNFKTTIHLLRHPCAVVASQLKFGAWDDIEHSFTEDELKPDGFIENYYNIIKPINKIEEKLSAIWCLDNIIPLTQNHENKWKTITYENLLINPEETFKFINIPYTSEIKNKLYKPSSTTVKGSPVNNNENDIVKQLSYWKQTLTQEQINNIITIVKAFQISIYDEDIYPKMNT